MAPTSRGPKKALGGGKRTVNAVNVKNDPERFKQGDDREWADYIYGLLPPGAAIGRCIACLSSDHAWSRDFTECDRCPFCGEDFLSADGHLAAECHKCPSSKKDIWKAVAEPPDE